MQIKILFFAAARDWFGRDALVLELDETANLSDLKRALDGLRPTPQDFYRAIRFAINLEYVANDAHLNAGDEVALIPPVSGG